MPELYSRVASAALKKESSPNVAVIPDTFVPINDEGISTAYGHSPSMPVSANRAKKLRAVINKIPAPAGPVNLNIEPKTFPHFMNGLFGSVTSGSYIDISGGSGTFQVGETITGGTSTETATIEVVGTDYLIVSSVSGAFTDGETLTGGTSSATATLGTYDATVYGHVGVTPSSSEVTYTLQINYDTEAIRYIGCRFHGLDALAQSDNIITAGIQVMAQGQFRHAKVTAAVTSGAGSKTITVDQTYGLVASDSIKVYRPGTGFLDFSASSTKTHSIGSITNSTQFVVTNLETSLQVGDLIMLAPQTASYTIGNEFAWIGGSQISTGDAIGSVATADAEDYSIKLINEYQERHAANGTDFADRFPSALLRKGYEASGNFKAYRQNEEFYRHLRITTAQALRYVTTGDQIGSTGVYNKVDWEFPEIYFEPYDTNITQDDIVDEDINYEAYYSDTAGHQARILVVNDVSSY